MKYLWLLCMAVLLGSCSYLPLTPIPTDGFVVTDHQDYLELAPASGSPATTGLMFWPGGLVDPHAYVASLGVFAARGYRVVIAKVPMNLAITQIGKGYDLARRLGGKWVAGGHSLGGTTAAWSVYDHQAAFEALVLLASYPATSTPLTSWSKPVLSLRGEFDQLATEAKIEAAKSDLPTSGTGSAHTQYEVISGGNHAQWGDYGPQDGDGTATINKSSQWTQLADKLVAFWSANNL